MPSNVLYYTTPNTAATTWDTWTSAATTATWNTWVVPVTSTADTWQTWTTTTYDALSAATVWEAWTVVEGQQYTVTYRISDHELMNAGIRADAWRIWQDTANQQLQAAVNRVAQPDKAQLKAQQEAYERQQAQWREAERKREEARTAAKERARMLLHAMLSVQQRESLERSRFFDFVSQTGKLMRMRVGSHGNVDELDSTGRRIAHYCAPARYQPDSYDPDMPHDIPTEDHMVAQLCALKYNEQEFFGVANRTVH